MTRERCADAPQMNAELRLAMRSLNLPGAECGVKHCPSNPMTYHDPCVLVNTATTNGRTVTVVDRSHTLHVVRTQSKHCHVKLPCSSLTRLSIPPIKLETTWLSGLVRTSYAALDSEYDVLDSGLDQTVPLPVQR